MTESYFSYDQVYSYIRHSTLMPNRISLLFLHGIGDSSLSFLPFLQDQRLEQFNRLMPDFLGYGKSSQTADYSFAKQVEIVVEHILMLEKNSGLSLDNIVLIAHSMAGTHAMLLCESVLRGKIKAVINVEGTITQYGSFVSEKVVDVSAQGQFATWFNTFKEIDIFEKFVKKFPSSRSYYACLQFCDPRAFQQNALEIRQVCYGSTGKKFVELNLPKIYCYGDKSLCHESIDFLNDNQIPKKIFHTENHFVMSDCYNEFIEFIIDWIKYNKIT